MLDNIILFAIIYLVNAIKIITEIFKGEKMVLETKQKEEKVIKVGKEKELKIVEIYGEKDFDEILSYFIKIISPHIEELLGGKNV
ncbi:MAG: hypothetical protein N3D74_04580 [Caldisericia bacterium]|nr:hypothetical protein [Caldisericia bacterium]